MKLRVGFITNSSSTSFIVKNISDTTKTMLDLLQEASDDIFADWRAMPECYLPRYSWRAYLDDENLEKHPMDRSFDYANSPEFLNEVASVKEFPPNKEVKVTFQWANVQGYMALKSKSKSFETVDVEALDDYDEDDYD